MSEVNSSLIRLGYWVNHSQGCFLGATITIDQRYANLFIALLAILVSVAASSWWNILLFVAHRLRATDESKDGLYRQQQILLRTLAAPGAFAVECIKLFAAWRRQGRSVCWHCLVPAAVGICFAAASLTAGIFSSYIVSTTDLQVLVDGSSCLLVNMSSYWDKHEDGQSPEYLSAFNSLNNYFNDLSPAYAQQCYSNGSVPSGCGFYVSPRIESFPQNLDCPFRDNLCAKTTEAGFQAMRLDTGFLDSNDFFGLNAPPEDRVQLRRLVTCAPLDVANHVGILPYDDTTSWRYDTGIANREPFPSETFWTFEYGSVRVHESDVQPVYPQDVTSIHSMLVSNTTLTFTTDFRMASSASEMKGWDSYYDPLEGLKDDNADITVLLVFTNNVLYHDPIDDPMYSAHRLWQGGFNGKSSIRYSSDRPAAVMGCIEQYEYCFTGAEGARQCTPPMGASHSSFQEYLSAGINERQLATLTLLGKAASYTGLYDAIQATPPFMDVTTLYTHGMLTGLPDDQWTIDFAKMESLVLATIQVFVISQASGYSGVTGGNLYAAASTPEEQVICNNQKVVKAGGFANINVFGLAFTLAWSLLLLLLDFGLMRLSISKRAIKQKLSPGIQAWIDDGVFQLQRVAYERYTKPWVRRSEEIPRNRRDADLPSLRSLESGSR